MQTKRFEKRVGLFILAALVLLTVLLLQFSSGTARFGNTYRINVRTANVSGMTRGAAVQLSGVKVGSVSEIVLDPDGKTVILKLDIEEDYKIHGDARFAIETSGFLGDQFVAIYPQGNEAKVLKDDAVVTAEEPFNIQEMARAATGFLERINDTARRLNQTIDRIDRTVLNEATLRDLAETAANLKSVSTQSMGAIQELQLLLRTNAGPLSASVSNVHGFTVELNLAASDLRGLINTSTSRVANAMNNIESATESLESLVQDVQAGKGLAGSLIYDPQLSSDMAQILGNLSITTSNLNSRGLWGILWKPKQPKADRRPNNQPEETEYQGRSPFD